MSWLEKNERKIVVGLIIAVLLFFIGELAFGYARAGSDKYFIGAQIMNQSDYPIYLSFIEQARQGKILMDNLYTSGPQTPILFSPLWLILGLICKLTTWSATLIFHLARIILIAPFLALIYWFIKKFLPDTRERLICFVLLLLASGVGAWQMALQYSGKAVFTPVEVYFLFPTDMWVMEANTFLTMSHSALFILSQILILGIFAFFLGRYHHWRLILTSIAIVLLGILHPYDLVLVFAVLAAYLIFTWWRQKKIVLWQVLSCCWLAVLAFPTGLYYLYITQAEPLIGGWARQNTTPSPPLLNYLYGFGLTLLFGIIGAWLVIKYKQERFYFPLIWLLVAIVLIYSPIAWQRRLLNGVQIPLMILVTVGLRPVRQFLWRKKSGISIILAILVVVFGFFFTNIINAAEVLRVYNNREFPFYISRAESQAAFWLRDHSQFGEAVAAETRFSNLIPALTGRTVYTGHGHQTIDFWEKKYILEDWFFGNNNNDTSKAEFLRQNYINYLWYSDREKNLGNFNPSEKNYLRSIYKNEEVEIYRIL